MQISPDSLLRNKICTFVLTARAHSHGDVEEDGEEELVVDRHGDEPEILFFIFESILCAI